MNKIEKSISTILSELGEDVTREGLQETPARYRKVMGDFLAPPEFHPTVFSNEGYDEMVIQANISFYSLCEHHLLPFFGVGAICYIPDKHIIGLSKLARTLEYFSRRLQNQERITNQVADYLEQTLSPKGVGVVLKARHMCMEMRGVSKNNVETTTSSLRGYVKTRPRTRSEFLSLIKRSKT